MNFSPRKIAFLPAGTRGLLIVFLVFGFLNILGFLNGCMNSEYKRPYGYLRLGTAEELKDATRVYRDKLRLLLRRDERGFYVMSTICPYDRLPLIPVKEGDTVHFVSPHSRSKYSLTGDPLGGPSTYKLPYYRLEYADDLGQGKLIFAQVGSEVDRSWRLAPLSGNESEGGGLGESSSSKDSLEDSPSSP